MNKKIIQTAILAIVTVASSAWAQQQPLEDKVVRELRSRPENPLNLRASGDWQGDVKILPDSRTGRVVVATPGEMQFYSGPQATENAAYLGVAGVPVDPALREQLNLKKGIGVLVERVESPSPADDAGIKRYDVIEKMDDQLMVNGQQLAVLVRTHKAGDEVKFSIIRQGQRKELTATLIEKEVPMLDEKNLWGQPGPFQGTVTSGNGTLILNRPTMTAGNKLSELMKSNNASMKMTDGGYTFSFTTQDGHTILRAMDVQGNIVFDGPVDTDEQIKLLPAEIADKVKPMVQLNGQLLRPRAVQRP